MITNGDHKGHIFLSHPNMSAHTLLNLKKIVGKDIKCKAMQSILSYFSQKIDDVQ